MASPSLTATSVPADTSEFFRAELAAFVAMNKRLRPEAWARVEQLQRVCISAAPAAGLDQAIRALGLEEESRARAIMSQRAEASA